MSKNQKIALFFLTLAMLIVLFVGSSSVLAYFGSITPKEIISRTNIWTPQQKQVAVNELTAAGYSLEKEYSYDEVQKIVAEMLSRSENREIWQEADSALASRSIVMAKGNCNFENWAGTDSYDRCSQTCSSLDSCTDCCKRGWPEGGGPSQDQQRGWCIRHCTDKFDGRTETPLSHTAVFNPETK